MTGGTFTGNDAGDYGGAIYSDDGISVNGATFTGNSAADYSGAIEIDDTGTVTGSHVHPEHLRVRGCHRRRRDGDRESVDLHQEQFVPSRGAIELRLAPGRP